MGDDFLKKFSLSKRNESISDVIVWVSKNYLERRYTEYDVNISSAGDTQLNTVNVQVMGTITDIMTGVLYF